MHIRYKIIFFLFVLFFPGKAYSDPGWRDYFDYAGVTWTVEEFRTIGSGHNSVLNFTPGFYSATLNDGVDVHTDTSFDIFLGKKFGQTRGEVNYSKNSFKDLRTSYFKQDHYLNTDFTIQELNFNGFYDLFQSKGLNFSIGSGLGIAMVKMTGETYRTSDGLSATKINDNHNDTIFTYNVSLGSSYRFRSDALLDIRVGHKEFMNEIRQQTTKISNNTANGYVTSDLSSNFIKFRAVKEF